MELLNFDNLEPAKVQVKYQGKIYILLECDGETEMAWWDANIQAARLGPDGKPSSVVGLAQTDSLLLSRCLYHATAEGELPLTKEGKPDKSKLVPRQTIQGFQHRVMQDLYDKAVEIGRLATKETVASLQKQIDKLQKRIDEIKAEENASKNSSTNGHLGSAAETPLVATPSS